MNLGIFNAMDLKDDRKPTNEEFFLSILRNHPYADSYKGTIQALEDMVVKTKIKKNEYDRSRIYPNSG